MSCSLRPSRRSVQAGHAVHWQDPPLNLPRAAVTGLTTKPTEADARTSRCSWRGARLTGARSESTWRPCASPPPAAPASSTPAHRMVVPDRKLLSRGQHSVATSAAPDQITVAVLTAFVRSRAGAVHPSTRTASWESSDHVGFLGRLRVGVTRWGWVAAWCPRTSRRGRQAGPNASDRRTGTCTPRSILTGRQPTMATVSQSTTPWNDRASGRPGPLCRIRSTERGSHGTPTKRTGNAQPNHSQVSDACCWMKTCIPALRGVWSLHR